MNELEIAILIVVSFLLLLSVVNMVMYWSKGKSAGYNYGRHSRGCPCVSCRGGVVEGLNEYKAAGLRGVINDTDWQQEIQSVGVDPATKFSHQEWQTELLGRTTGASPWTVRDDDINSNWLGLGWGKTWKQIYAQPGARVSESNDWQDMPSNPNIRWRCHNYISEGQKSSLKPCPWPPETDQRYS